MTWSSAEWKRKLVADGFGKGNSFSGFFCFSLSASIFIRKVHRAQMADTINISDKVLMAQSRTKTSQRLLTYIRQAPGLTPIHSSVLRDLNELIFTPFKSRGKQEMFKTMEKAHYFFRLWVQEEDTILSPHPTRIADLLSYILCKDKYRKI